jgi:hypothetical protein
MSSRSSTDDDVEGRPVDDDLAGRLDTESGTKDSPSELQIRDVRNIMALQPDLDWHYVDRWSIRLTVAALLRRLRS